MSAIPFTAKQLFPLCNLVLPGWVALAIKPRSPMTVSKRHMKQCMSINKKKQQTKLKQTFSLQQTKQNKTQNRKKSTLEYL